MKFPVILSLLILFVGLGGCSIPFIGGSSEAEYREVYSIARVHQTGAEAVEFEITGHRNVELSRSEIPPEFVYSQGKEFYVRQRFLVDGDGKKYLLEILREVGQIL